MGSLKLLSSRGSLQSDWSVAFRALRLCDHKNDKRGSLSSKKSKTLKKVRRILGILSRCITLTLSSPLFAENEHFPFHQRGKTPLPSVHTNDDNRKPEDHSAYFWMNFVRARVCVGDAVVSSNARSIELGTIYFSLLVVACHPWLQCKCVNVL